MILADGLTPRSSCIFLVVHWLFTWLLCKTQVVNFRPPPFYATDLIKILIDSYERKCNDNAWADHPSPLSALYIVYERSLIYPTFTFSALTTWLIFFLIQGVCSCQILLNSGKQDKYIVACQQGGVSNKPPGQRHGARDPLVRPQINT